VDFVSISRNNTPKYKSQQPLPPNTPKLQITVRKEYVFTFLQCSSELAVSGIGAE